MCERGEMAAAIRSPSAARVAAAMACTLVMAACGTNGEKIVLNTPWWPPGTERKAESVGIKTSDLIFCTGMMEQNKTTWRPSDVIAEIHDVSDIVKAGNATLKHLVACLVNVPAHHGNATAAALAFRKGLREAGGNPDQVALMTVPMEGEYGSWFGTSTSCVATTHAAETKHTARAVSASGAATAVVVAAGNLAHVAAESTSVDVATDLLDGAVAPALRGAGVAAGTTALLECTAFVRDADDARAVRDALQGHSPASPAPAGGIVLNPARLFPPPHTAPARVRLRCTATPLTRRTRPRWRYHMRHTSVRSFRGGRAGLRFRDRRGAANASDAFARLGELLELAGSSLSLAANCRFFLRDGTAMKALFGGFFAAFNRDHPPPPARTEYAGVASDTCAEEEDDGTGVARAPGCAVVVKCEAVLSP